MDALKQEIERLEEETKGKPFVEKEEEAPVSVDSEEQEEVVEETPEAQKQEKVLEGVAEAKDGKQEEQADPEEEERLRKQEQYRERQRQKKEEAKRQAELAAQAKLAEDRARQAQDNTVDEDYLLKQELRQVLYKERFKEVVKKAEKELTELEKDFKVAFTDYDESVNMALELTKDRLVSSGMSEHEASEHLRLEKIKIADAAAARGDDPVEAVYKEAKAINSWFEAQAEKLGYVKPSSAKPKTQKAALKEASKPNAIVGGSNASSIKMTYDELEDISDIKEVTIGDLLRGSR